MKKLIVAGIFVCMVVVSFGQAAYVLPSPTNANEELTLYIDVSQSAEGTSNNALKAMLIDHPDDDVYLWSWMPAEPIAGNGNWDVSNDALKLTKIGELLYTITFIPTDFYGVDGSTLFANGISCLAKLQDGNAYPDDYEGEAKTEDLIIELVPKLCDARICIYPEIRQVDDFIHITYHNGQEEITGLQNMMSEECYVHMVAKTGPFSFYEYTSSANVTSTPELQMKLVEGEPSKFRLIFIPSDFFSMVPEGEEITEIIFRIMRPGFTYVGAPPQEILSILTCE
ncbi:MAG: hypothetical protein ACJAU0_002442 [Flavobacteriales bacterium]|jgi:hypothetical protein